MKQKTIALAGNPNVGKSTLFNALTGLRQHTGNWPGKTVTSARGHCYTNAYDYELVDLPGTYSLRAHSAEEEVAREFICNACPDAVIVVCDGTCLERNLNLVLQIMEISSRVIVCVNLMDEAARKGIKIDIPLLSQRLGVPVVGITARKKKTITRLLDTLDFVVNADETQQCKTQEPAQTPAMYAEEICRDAVVYENKQYMKADRKIDGILTSRIFGYPLMLILLLFVFWLTITGANYPSRVISNGLFWIENRLTVFFVWANAPEWLYGILVLGIYRVLAWVVSVMLPPMAIFFPLFTLLEDAGLLPRIAYNLDKVFQKCHACGKQALCMCMGFGCNAAGVIGCRIIDSPRERLLAILTNSFVPCNGRFPTIIAIICMFFVGTAGGIVASAKSAALLTMIILLGVAITFVITGILSRTLLKGISSSITLELPPYRKPQIGRVLIRSLLDRTLFVLSRAVIVAIPAGMLIWLMANIKVNDYSILNYCADFLDPFARIMGLDGVILMAFILGFPANEIVIPIIIMTYLAQGSIFELGSLEQIKTLLVEHGWTGVTAVCVLLFSLNHWPCSTTLLTIKKETASIKWAILAAGIPTFVGICLCTIVATIARFVK